MNASPPTTEPIVPSPCNGVCRIGERGHCLGCGRVVDEIVIWSRASNDQKLRIRAQAEVRLLDEREDPATR